MYMKEVSQAAKNGAFVRVDLCAGGGIFFFFLAEAAEIDLQPLLSREFVRHMLY